MALSKSRAKRTRRDHSENDPGRSLCKALIVNVIDNSRQDLIFLLSRGVVWYSQGDNIGALVKADDESREGGRARFHTTQWTVIMLAAQSKTPEGEAALAELYELYWFPLYAYARRRGHSPHDAQDLTQGFFVDLMERRALTQGDRLKGKFRSFLLTSFQNYLSVEAQRARCLKRGGATHFVSLDIEDAEDRYVVEPAEYLTSEKLFDARWAMTLLKEVLNRLRQT
jgi:DNA-directed RNA polymerase specialized sigma24 family protein